MSDSSNFTNFIGQSYEIALNKSMQALLNSLQNPNSTNLISNFYELLQSKIDPPLETIWVFSALSFLKTNLAKNDPLDQLSAIKDLFQIIISCSASCNSIKFIVWIGSNVAENGNIKETLRVFFPLLSNEILEKVNIEGCEMSELAGFVIAEAFLLKVCLKMQEGSGKELQNELRTWVVASITAFRNAHFYVTLVRMLLEPMLPVTSLTTPENEVLLRKILYDAVILVEYSFLAPGSLAQLPAKHKKNITLVKLMVTHEAIEYFRELADLNKATSYSNAFATSNLPSELLTWIRNETGSEVANSGPVGSSPKAFLRWMLNIENRGIRIFDDDMSKFRSKLISDSLKEDSDRLANKEERKTLDTDLFYIDNKGELGGNEENEMMSKSMNAAFMAAAHSIQSAEHEGTKRLAKKSEKRKRVKFLKYSLTENSESLAFPSNDGRSSGSDVENPSSDEDIWQVGLG
ncbi:hypothetical protein Adt_07639 [Abeliophyllum distichum]|uniref:CUE domain-containing protein n=1 Tax=Abeliophyllum distichum TaxID=126358 RepID=A0ABD1VCG8_9LAMI